MYPTVWKKLKMNLITFQPLSQYPANTEPLKSEKKTNKILLQKWNLNTSHLCHKNDLCE